MQPKKLWLIAIAAALLPAAAGAQPVTIRLGHVGFPGSLFDVAGNKFAQDVNQALKGKVEVRVFHSSQLGSDEQMIKGIRVGAPEMQIPSTVMSTVDQRFGVFEMPYLIVNRAHIKKAAENPQVQKALFEPLPARGIRVLGVWENGFRHITNNVRPIVKPEDLRGLKLRVPQGVWRVKMFQAYGANPSPMALSEVFVALQTGVMDGQENPLTQIASSKFQEVQKYLSMTGHVYTPAYLTAGKRKFESLPKEVQDILAQTAKDVQPFVYETAARLDGALADTIKSAGTQINDADKDAFIAQSKAVYEEFGKSVKDGAKLVDRAIELGTGM
jgi:tripartite ATP-independent transporter DctP family solute receptor